MKYPLPPIGFRSFPAKLEKQLQLATAAAQKLHEAQTGRIGASGKTHWQRSYLSWTCPRCNLCANSPSFLWVLPGMDGVCFLMSANVGEALKPMNKVASGGELARIMLALKNVLAEQDAV